jgi:PAS domain-containing protein
MSENPTYEKLENRIKALDKKMVDFKTMEKALRESKNKYYELVESLPALVFEIVDGKIADINKTQLQSFGYNDKSELIGKNATDFIKSEEVERGERGVKKCPM